MFLVFCFRVKFMIEITCSSPPCESTSTGLTSTRSKSLYTTRASTPSKSTAIRLTSTRRKSISTTRASTLGKSTSTELASTRNKSYILHVPPLQGKAHPLRVHSQDFHLLKVKQNLLKLLLTPMAVRHPLLQLRLKVHV